MSNLLKITSDDGQYWAMVSVDNLAKQLEGKMNIKSDRQVIAKVLDKHLPWLMEDLLKVADEIIVACQQYEPLKSQQEFEEIEELDVHILQYVSQQKDIMWKAINILIRNQKKLIQIVSELAEAKI